MFEQDKGFVSVFINDFSFQKAKKDYTDVVQTVS